MKELEAKYKSKFRNKLKWYKQDQNNPLLKCIIDDFDSTISDAFQELENRSCTNCFFNSSKDKNLELITCDKCLGFINQRIFKYCGSWKQIDI